MEFLLNLPVPISFLIVSAITTFVALAGLHFVRKKYSTEVLRENHEVAAIIFNAFGLFYGVMVAFVVFVTWSGYDEATKNLQMEANEADDLFHCAKAFPEPASTPPPAQKLTRLSWSGVIPPQKWMNFYTKVLTRFAVSPELQLEVSFEIPIDRDQAQSKADETRSGLKELGLDDNTLVS